MATKPAPVETAVDVEGVIEAVKKELAKAAKVAPHLRLTQFDLELSVVVKKEAGGGFSFKIPVLGVVVGPSGSGSVATESTTKLTLTFEAPRPAVSAQAVVPLEELPSALATIERSIDAGRKSDPRLNLKDGEVSFAFGVTRGAEGKTEIVVLEAFAKASREDAHTVTLKFEPIG